MTDAPDVPIWRLVLAELEDDDRITPQLEGFLNLAVAQGVMGGALYLDVPNDLTAGQINKRMREPIMDALAKIDGEANSFRVVTNPELAEKPYVPAPNPIGEEAQAREAAERSGPRPIEQVQAQPRSETRLNPKYTFDNFVIEQ